MAKEPNFASILDRPSNAAERPPAFPAGSYVAIVEGLPEYGKSTKKQTDFAEFKMKPIQALDDVDENALKEFGGLGEQTMKLTFYLTEKSEYRLREFLDDLGIPDEEDGQALSHRERIDNCPGQQCIIHVKHEPSQDGKSIFANISSTAPVEA